MEYVINRINPLAVTVDQVKTQCRLDHDLDASEQALIETYIKAAVKYAESYQQRVIVESNMGLALDYFPCQIKLKPPVQEILSIEYIDSNGESQTLPAEQYVLNDKSIPCRIVPAHGTSFPESRRQPNAVTVTYKAGYSEIPDETQLAILFLAAHWYENREPIVTGTIVQNVPMTVDSLLSLNCWGSYS